MASDRSEREADMSLYELPDDDPLSDEELARLDYQRAYSQAMLANRAAGRGQTPMEMMASGDVVAEMPDDRLVFDPARQLPTADDIAVEQLTHPKTDNDAMVDAIHYALGTRTPPPRRKSAIQEWLDTQGPKAFAEGFNEYFARAPFEQVDTPVALDTEPVDDDEVVDGEIVE